MWIPALRVKSEMVLSGRTVGFLHGKLPILLIAALYVLIAGLYAVFTPAWQAPDEPAHYNYVAYVARTGRLPVLRMGDYPHRYLEEIKSKRFPPEMPIEPIRYEFHQPPLYYLLAVPLYLAFGGSLTALRLFSVFLGCGTVWLAFLIAREIFPGEGVRELSLAWGTAAFVAFVPMHVAITAAVNNDALAELLLAAFLLAAVRWLKTDGAPPAQATRMALFAALGLVTKTTTYIALPLLAVAWALVCLRPLRPRDEGSGPCRPGAFLRSLVPLALALPWFLRNAAVYGLRDPLGLSRHDAVVAGQLRTSEWLAQTGLPQAVRQFLLTTFRSFWGQFGWMALPMDERVYALLALACALAAFGLAIRIRRGGFEPRQIRALCLLALSLALTTGSYLWYNLKFVQHQGRYLFPAIVPIGLGFGVGLLEAVRRRPARTAAFALAALAVLLVLKGAAFGDWNELSIAGLLVGAGLCALRAILPDAPVLDALAVSAFFAFLALLDVFALFRWIVPLLRP